MRSITWPLLLIVVGFIFLMSNLTAYGWKQLWPLIIVALGIGDVWKSFKR